MSIPRKNVLLLSKVIERGLADGEALSDDNILGIAPKDSLKELKSISDDLLKKPGLIEMID